MKIFKLFTLIIIKVIPKPSRRLSAATLPSKKYTATNLSQKN